MVWDGVGLTRPETRMGWAGPRRSSTNGQSEVDDLVPVAEWKRLLLTEIATHGANLISVGLPQACSAAAAAAQEEVEGRPLTALSPLLPAAAPAPVPVPGPSQPRRPHHHHQQRPHPHRRRQPQCRLDGAAAASAHVAAVAGLSDDAEEVRAAAVALAVALAAAAPGLPAGTHFGSAVSLADDVFMRLCGAVSDPARGLRLAALTALGGRRGWVDRRVVCSSTRTHSKQWEARRCSRL